MSLFSPHWIRSRHKAKSPHYSYKKAMKARRSCFQSETKEQFNITTRFRPVLLAWLHSFQMQWNVACEPIFNRRTNAPSQEQHQLFLTAECHQYRTPHIFLWLPCFCTQQCILMPVHSLLRHSPSFSSSTWHRLAGNYPVQKFVAIFPYVLPWEWNFQPKCCKSQSHKLIQSCKKRKPRSEVFTT